MTTRTRYFVIASLLVLTVGVGTGLVAYYVGFPTSAFSTEGGAQELRYVPRDAAVVAFANVQEIMTSELRQRIKATVPIPENGQQEFANQTGINIETDIDHIVACPAAFTRHGDAERRNGRRDRPVRRREDRVADARARR